MDTDKIVGFIMVVVFLFIAATIGGFIIWLIWPVVMYNIFPGLVENKLIVGEIGLWPAICLSWLCALLIKSSNTNNNKKD